ncbi:MAG: B12-binding domain-containing radical SAM protein [Nitrospirae bacterium]|nr:B12-binding domain-containing radical SAM protein [Nitrospirota bacterium]
MKGKILFVWPHIENFGFHSLAIAMLSAICKKNGYETRLLDTTEVKFDFDVDTNNPQETARMFKPTNIIELYGSKKEIKLEEYFMNVYKQFSPDIIAISILSDERFVARDFVNIVRSINKTIPIVVGGKYPTIKQEKMFEEMDVDYVCVGEGVEAFPELIAAIFDGLDTTKVENFIVKQKNGSFVKNVVRPLKKSIDDLPYFDFDIFDRKHFYRPYDGNIYISGSHMLNWGCPYHCSYCINSFYHVMYDKKYFLRRYSVNRIIDELVYLKDRFNLQFFKFYDEDFLMRPLDNLKELSEEYRKRINLPFTIETNPKSVTREKAELLLAMNCVSASLAIETGNSLLRKNVLKRVDTREDIIRSFHLLKDIGIRTSSFNMLGLPFETRETYMDTVELNRDADVNYPVAGFFYPYESTLLREISIREGFYKPLMDESKICRSNVPALEFSNLTEEELIEMRNVFTLYIKLPKTFIPYIKRSEKMDDVGKKVRVFLFDIFDRLVFCNNGWYKDDGNEAVYLAELEKIASSGSTN